MQSSKLAALLNLGRPFGSFEACSIRKVTQDSANGCIGLLRAQISYCSWRSCYRRTVAYSRSLCTVPCLLEFLLTNVCQRDAGAMTFSNVVSCSHAISFQPFGSKECAIEKTPPSSLDIHVAFLIQPFHPVGLCLSAGNPAVMTTKWGFGLGV